MYENWQQILMDLIVGYFSDEGAEAGLKQAAVVSVARESLYHDYVAALEAGIESAGRGESDVLRIVRPVKLLKDPAAAKVYLEWVLSRFQTLYDETVKARAATPWPGDQGGT